MAGMLPLRHVTRAVLAFAVLALTLLVALFPTARQAEALSSSTFIAKTASWAQAGERIESQLPRAEGSDR